MAGILDRYGIKEVADVTFYKLDDAGIPQYPVLYLDTLKVSTIEQTADEATANGGKGNPPLVIWDYNKDITVTLEDALFSAKSLAIMFGNGTLKPIKKTNDKQWIMKTETFTCKASGAANAEGSGWESKYTDPNGKAHTKAHPKFYDAEGKFVGNDSAQALVQGVKYFCSYDLEVEGSVVEISADSFPGTYYVTGDTYARSDVNGEDEFFQFIIPKAKVQSENTITLEADGDPSTFNMSLHVMRPENGKMMMLVKYNAVEGEEVAGSVDSEVYHNHYLDQADPGYEIADRGTEDGALRFKTLPMRATYAFANLDELDGIALQQYDADTKQWSDVDIADIVCYDNSTKQTLSSLTTSGAVVWYEVDGDTDHHKTQTIQLLASEDNLSVSSGG